MPFSSMFRRLQSVHRYNVDVLKSSPVSELSGSLGDLGTLLPLMTALALTGSISLPSTLLFTGAANILTGIAFGIPLPVQPMKAIAAVAIARKFTIEENAAAGLVVATLVGICSITGVIHWANKVTPIPVVKGIQVGAGLSLCISAGTTLLAPLTWNGPWWGDNLLWALAAGLFLLLTYAYPRMPYALIVFSIGICLSLFSPLSHSNKSFASAIPVVRPSALDFWKATTTASLGQLPLTILNSIIAVAALTSDLLPSPPHPVSPTVTEIGVSVAAINLVGCWFGAMPACHGSGGLAGQYRFGARSGSSIIILGSVKLLLGLLSLFRPALIVEILSGIPKSLLGVLVLAAGIELAKVGESLNTDASDLRVLREGCVWDGKEVRHVDDSERRQRWMVMLVTVATLLAFKNDAVGFLAGITWHWGMEAGRRVQSWREETGERRLFWRRERHADAERTWLLRREGSDVSPEQCGIRT
ncbi:sulfate transporter [Westerdykella ornata]|uniref:Sulfate transporter n=1 Tax=Westerdykella ornata TaxID=318751 RepID=A0A6A6JLK1_WESOR|nr:sulfate transporter [Westerdykella ornata]KAF2277124.1 sulfate transporter [Westerdykella ornata]